MSVRTPSCNVWIVSSKSIAKICDLIPANQGRQSLSAGLIEAYELQHKCGLIQVGSISEQDIRAYHTEQYINCLLRNRNRLDSQSLETSAIRELIQELNSECGLNEIQDCLYFQLENDSVEEDSSEDLDQLKEFNLSFDCYPFPFMATYAKVVAATSIYTAKQLVETRFEGTQNIAINWYGGRHHCTKLRAAGYCYINDIILAIRLLRRSFQKVFYLDLDLHHGDGVELAYKFSKNVFTCSIHRYDLGFYPGTGSLHSSGPNRVNIPTKRGLSDSSILFILTEIVIPIIENYSPQVLVIQAGCDGLGTDSHKEWNLTIKGFGTIFELLKNKFNIPIMILGGGGYNHSETAKCWAYITKILVNDSEEWDVIPDHDHIDAYADDSFQFWTSENLQPKKMQDENDFEYLNKLKEYLSFI